jgi:hypothetical protein
MWRMERRVRVKGTGAGAMQRERRTDMTTLRWGKDFIGILVGAAASLLAVYALRRGSGHRPFRGRWAQSGQAPSRNHIRLSTHPAAQS